MLPLLPLLLLALISGRTHPLPKGMEVTQTLYSDPMALYEVCGQFGSCAFSDRETYCDMHLKQAWNGDPLSYEHEISECGGRLDAPEVGEHD